MLDTFKILLFFSNQLEINQKIELVRVPVHKGIAGNENPRMLGRNIS